MSSRARLVMVQVVVAATATVGAVAAAQPASAAAPVLNCWSYTPAPAPLVPPAEPPRDADGRLALADVPLNDLPLSGATSAMQPWNADPEAAYSLTTSGSTVAGGTRTFTLSLPAPVVTETLPTPVAVRLHLALGNVDLPVVTAVAPAAVPNEPLEPFQVSGKFTVPAAGPQNLQVRAIFLDAPSDVLPVYRLACNGQTAEEPTQPGAPDPEDPTKTIPGANPATKPVDVDLSAEFTALASSTGGISAVDKQAVTTAARPGDRLLFSVTGFGSGSQVSAELCSATGVCAPTTTFPADAAGAGSGGLTLPRDFAPGAATLTFTDDAADTPATASTPITVLGLPSITVEEERGSEETLVSVTGAGWDPGRDLTLRGHVRTSASSPRSSDQNVVLTTAVDGTVSGEFVVTDERTRTMSATQRRSDGSRLRTRVDLEGLLAADGEEQEPPAGPSDPSPQATAPLPTDVVVPPVSIPLPGEVPVDVVPAPSETPASPEAEELLSVADARLEGSTQMGEMFGGSPERTLVFEVTNEGPAPVTDPVVAVAVGRSVELQPSPVETEVGTLEPGESATVEVPIALPAASFGTYQVVGQVGDSPAAAFRVEWISYPYGLFALNLLGAGLLALGVRRRIAARPSPRLLPAPVLAASLVPPMNSEAVVDLGRLETWWELKDKGVRPAAAPLLPTLVAALPAAVRPGTATAETADAVVDMDAADLWWRRQIDPSPMALSDAVVDLEAAEKWWSESQAGASTRA